ncbi:MAG: WD40 repeat domain-containing protein [Bacteroidota bacterium]
MTRILPALFALFLLALLGCEKEKIDNSDKNYPIQITATKPGRNVLLEWTKTNISSFEKYVIVSSTDSIPDSPTPAGFVVANLDDVDENHFEDVNIPIAERIFYKVYVDVGDRFLFSPTISVKLEFNLLDISATKIEPYLPKKELFIYDNTRQKLVRYNYETEEIKGELSLPDIFALNYSIGENGSGYELYLNKDNSTKLEIFDAETMTLKTSITAPGNIYCIATGSKGYIFLGTSSWQNGLAVYRRNDKNLVESYNSGISFEHRMDVSANGLELVEVSFDVLNYYILDEQGQVLQQKKQSLFLTPLEKIAISPDGEFFLPAFEGIVFNKDLEVVDKVPDVNFGAFPDFAFSPDGDRLFAASFNLELREFSFPNLTLNETMPLNYSVRRVYTDEGNLIVVGAVFVSGQNKTIIDKLPIN